MVIFILLGKTLESYKLRQSKTRENDTQKTCTTINRQKAIKMSTAFQRSAIKLCRKYY